MSWSEMKHELTVFGLPVQMTVVRDDDVPSDPVQLQAVLHVIISRDTGVHNITPIFIMSWYLEKFKNYQYCYMYFIRKLIKFKNSNNQWKIFLRVIEN